MYRQGRGLGMEIDKSYGSMRAQRKKISIFTTMTMEMSKIKNISILFAATNKIANFIFRYIFPLAP